MKKFAYILFSVALLSISAIDASAQGQSRPVSNFTAITSSGSFNVFVKMDGNESVRVEANADVINDIETVVEGSTLRIGVKDNWQSRHRDFGRVNIYVEAKSLSALTNSGSGAIKVDGNISAGNFKATLSGSGDISTGVKSDELRAVISGSGSIKLWGGTSTANFVITGSGEIDGKKLKTGSSSAVITGSGNVYVAADRTVSAHITGSGSLIYSGSANVTDSHYTGSGRVSKDGD
jgi:hypothetical protein